MKLSIPSTMETIFLKLSSTFTKPTQENFTLLCMGTIITRGKRTITNIIRSIKPMRNKHFGTYHRFLSRASYSLMRLSRILCSMIIPLLSQTITIIVDEKIVQHQGRHVYGRGLYQDNRNTARKRCHYIYGHKWLVFCLSVPLPFCSRPWALPFMVFFAPSKKTSKRMNRPYRSLAHMCIFALKTMHRWFPDRHVKLVGDGMFAMFDLSRFCASHSPWCTLISRLRSNADLFAIPTIDTQQRRGRRRIKGAPLPKPKDIQADPHTPWQKTWLPLAQNKRRFVRFYLFEALMYRAGRGIVPITCVVTDSCDPATGRPEAFFSTQTQNSAHQIINDYILRWSIEVTFEEATAHLGIESTRNYSKNSVLRSFPLLLCLFSVVSLWFYRVASQQKNMLCSCDWYKKDEPTFADALYFMRRHFWDANIFSNSSFDHDFIKIDRSLLYSLCEQLSCAA